MERRFGCKMAATRPIQQQTRPMSHNIAAFIASSLLLAALPSHAQEIDSTVHKLCSETRDYVGCVKANTKITKINKKVTSGNTKITSGNIESTSENLKKTKKVEAEREVISNSCPTGYAYSGAGDCTNVLCAWEAGDDSQLIGKTWKCPEGLQKQSLRWGDTITKATFDSKCPSRQPRVGWQSSCEER